MEQTREELCDKIAELKSEIASYEMELKRMDYETTTKFKEKVESMVGGYYTHNLGDFKWYCRINRVEQIQDSNIDGLYARCECTVVLIPKDPKDRYQAYVDYIYIDESELADYKPITEGEFAAVVDQFNKALKKI